MLQWVKIFMYKNKMLSFFLLLPVLLTACAEKKEPGKILIGFLLKTMQEERYQKDKFVFMNKAQALGVDVFFDSANNDEITQLSKFENMLAKGCRVIVLQPVNTRTAGNMVKIAHEEGVKVVGYDSMLRDGPLDVMVMQDSWAVGKLQGQAMLDWLKRKKGKIEGNIVIIKGQPGDSNVNAMSSGALEIINRYPGLKLLAEHSHANWSPEQAMATAENVLTKYDNQVDAFICNNSGMCRGVIAALNNVGLSDSELVFTAGADADLVNIKYIAQDKQTIDIWKKIKPLAEKSAQLAVLLARNPGKEPQQLVSIDKMIYNGQMFIPTIVTPVVLIDKNNIDRTLIAADFYSRKQVYGD